MKALFRCEKNWQKINVQRFSANFLFSKNGKCRSITYSGDFATLPFIQSTIIFLLHTYKYHYEYIVHYNREPYRFLRIRSD